MRHHFYTLIVLSLLSSVSAFAQALVPLNTLPTRVVGHPQAEQLTIASGLTPNLVEGRELAGPRGVAIDTSVTPNILYVADTGNHRVLAWKNAAAFSNGQMADIVIGQQDFYRTTAQGPGQQFSTGLNAPTGLAVDVNGNLYVADTGNNRILRFRKPAANQGPYFPDLYIGQPNLNSRTANYTGTIAAQGLSLQGFAVNMAFDSAGNLWVTDPGNRRVLRFKGTDVAAGGGPLEADLVLGQDGFTGPLRAAVTNSTRATADSFAIPAAIAFDSSGRLYVSDSDASNTFGRVLVFLPPFNSGMVARRIMGIFPPSQPPTTPDQAARSTLIDPEGIFFIQTKVGVVDAGYSRILLFDTFESWPADVNTPPAATAVVGQRSFTAIGPNQAATTALIPSPSAGTLAVPLAAVFAGGELFVADSFNNRVVVLPQVSSTFLSAIRVLGQDRFDMMAPNLIEGREFDFVTTSGGNLFADAGMVIDATSGDVPHLYVSDPYNNRVLGFRDFRSVRPGVRADIVIGQLDFNTGRCNQTGDADHPTQSSLCRPVGLAVDPAGNLYVADSGNGRVLRFPSPFAQSTQVADLVLGQSNFTIKITDPSAATMSQPYGLAIAGNNGLLVSDLAHNRVLYFPFSGNGTFQAGVDNGRAATKVFGQPDFLTVTPGSSDSSLNGPRHITTDSEARPFVADTANNRVVIYDQVLVNPDRGAHASLILTGLTSPRSVFANQATGELWVGDSNTQGLVRKFPRFSTLVFNNASTGSVAAPGAALALAQDQYGNLAVADITNRVGIYYQALQSINGANFIPNRQLAPGVFASLCSPGSNCNPDTRVGIFGGAEESFASVPLPTTLADLQVLVNGVPAPLTYVSPSQINFIVPMNTPASGTADVQVVQASTGRVYAAGNPQMNVYSPGIFMLQFTGRNRQAAVLNEDSSVNSATNGAARGSYIQIFATGQGFLPNAPPDGASPSGLVTTPFTPHINIGGQFVEEYARESGEPAKGQEVSFSGLSPQFPGVWQINVYVPKAVAPGTTIPIAIFIGSLASADLPATGYVTTIAVK